MNWLALLWCILAVITTVWAIHATVTACAWQRRAAELMAIVRHQHDRIMDLEHRLNIDITIRSEPDDADWWKGDA